VGGLQVGFERGDARPLFDDGDDVVARGARRDAGGYVDSGAVFDAAVFVADDADDAVELGEEAFASAFRELDCGDDVDHGVTALGRMALAPLREARIRLVRNRPRLRRGVEAVLTLRAVSVWKATPGRSPGLESA